MKLLIFFSIGILTCQLVYKTLDVSDIIFEARKTNKANGT